MRTSTARQLWFRRPILLGDGLVAEGTPRPPWLSRMLIVIAMLGALVFCHGCHGGDHDDELFSRHWWSTLVKNR